jgi:hypothetical protein
MKKLAAIITLCTIMHFTVFSKTHIGETVKSDTIRDIKNQRKPKVVTSRAQRVRMQEHQIKVHDKQLKKVHAAQRKMKKEKQEQRSQ